MDFNIRTQVMGAGLENIGKMGSAIAETINGADPMNMNQVDMLQLQQKTAAYNNTISMMSTMLKNLSDTDKEVIRAM